MAAAPTGYQASVWLPMLAADYENPEIRDFLLTVMKEERMMPANEAILILSNEEWLQYEHIRVELREFYLDTARSYDRRHRVTWFIMGFHEDEFDEFQDLPPKPEFFEGFVHVVRD